MCWKATVKEVYEICIAQAEMPLWQLVGPIRDKAELYHWRLKALQAAKRELEAAPGSSHCAFVVDYWQQRVDTLGAVEECI